MDSRPSNNDVPSPTTPRPTSSSTNPDVERGSADSSKVDNATQVDTDGRSLLSVETFDHNLTIDSRLDGRSWLNLEVRKPCPITEKLGHSMNKNCERFNLKRSLFSFIPLLDRLRVYNWKTDFIADIIAGFTVAILQIPQGIAYALLIGIGANFGLYTSFFPVLIYAFLGTAQHISLGTMAVVDLMLRDIVKKYQTSDNAIVIPVNETYTSTIFKTPEEEASVEILTSLCLLVGLVQMAFGFLHFGAVSLILSDQLISGFSCGAAINVITSQIPSALQLTIEKRSGPLSLIRSLIDIIKSIPLCRTPTLILSGVVFASYIIYKSFFEGPLSRRIPFPVPFDLFIVVASTAIAYGCQLNSNYGINVMGNIPTGLPAPQIPRVDLFPNLLVDAVVIGVICFSICLSLGKIYGKKYGYEVRANQEFVAQGAANAFASFFLCFPATASLSRTSVMGQHAKSHVSSIVSCCFLLLVLLVLAPLLTHLPKPTVAVIIIVAQKNLVWQIKDLPKSWAVSRWEGLIWLVTFVSVLVLGLDLGLGMGVVFSIFSIVMRFYSPKLRRFGQLSNTDIFVDINHHPSVQELAGVKILQFSSPLFFLNKDLFKQSVLKKTLSGQKFRGNADYHYGPVKIVILDCSAMSFVDSAGVDAIVEVSSELKEQGIEVILASCPPPVLSMFMKADFFTRSPQTLLFPTVQDAIHRIRFPPAGNNLLSDSNKIPRAQDVFQRVIQDEDD